MNTQNKRNKKQQDK